MSNDIDIPFYVDRAKGGRASCKGCKQKCENAELRIAKVVASPYSEEQKMKSWYHIDCLMTTLLKQRPTTKRIDSVNDIGNWENISNDDQCFILEKINEMEKSFTEKHNNKFTLKFLKNDLHTLKTTDTILPKKEKKLNEQNKNNNTDNDFIQYITLLKKIAGEDAYLAKTAIVNDFFKKGSDKQCFKGDLALWCSLLLPGAVKRVYNLKSKQLVKLFSRIFNTDQDDMLTHLENGDIADTIVTFFNKSKTYKPLKSSSLTMMDVNEFLEKLTALTKEEEQIYHFKKIVTKCTEDDLRAIIRLIKGDLRINAGPKHILEGVHPDAYNIFQTSRDINLVLSRVISGPSGVKNLEVTQKSVQAKLLLMTPVLPMLAEACKSVEMAMKKCPNGMFSEIKYDGERVQVHKKGNEFKYFSRALKPVMPHKVNHFKDYIPKAFPRGDDLILDAEVLMVDVNTGKPLPFGSLGVHKQSEFKDAQVCLFVFDCIYYNGEVLTEKPMREKREILLRHMVEVTNHIMFSEQELIRKPADLANMIAKVLQLGLEGLVLKDLESTYAPGKRHWLKVKKDYLFGGAMADTADLVVLGAWFGTGKKGGMMSVFLMGCYDEKRDRWVTVTKVHTGHDDKTLQQLQEPLGKLMDKISQDNNRVPSWLNCTNTMVPDFVAKDPKNQPVWEITGTEFTKANIHTADGISVRFPRVTRIRADKDWKTATSLEELKTLFKNSKEKTDVSLLNKLAETATKCDDSAKSKPSTPKKTTINNMYSKIQKIDEFIMKIKPEKESPKKAYDDYDSTESKKKKIKVESTTAEDIEMEKDSSKEKTPIKIENIKLAPTDPLPNCFNNTKVAFYPDYISFPETVRRTLERHWVAYGGKVIKSIIATDANFIVHNKPLMNSKHLKMLHKRISKSARHVTTQWMTSCINKKNIVDTRRYAVRLNKTS